MSDTYLGPDIGTPTSIQRRKDRIWTLGAGRLPDQAWVANFTLVLPFREKEILLFSVSLGSLRNRHQSTRLFFFLIENAHTKTGRARTGCENSQPSIQVSPGMECRGGLPGECPRPPSGLGKVPRSPQRVLWWQSAEQCAPPLPGSCVAAAVLPSVTGGTASLSPVRA